MKKISKILLVIMCLFILTGCGGMSQGERNTVINKLKNEKVIDKKWEEVDYYGRFNYSMEHTDTKGYGYIYKDKDGNMYEVYISSYQKDSENKDVEVSNVEKYKISSVDNDMKKCKETDETTGKIVRCDYQWVTYKDDSQAPSSKYIRDESSKEAYKVYKTKKTILFFSYDTYKIEKYK